MMHGRLHMSTLFYNDGKEDHAMMKFLYDPHAKMSGLNRGMNQTMMFVYCYTSTFVTLLCSCMKIVISYSPPHRLGYIIDYTVRE